MSTEWRSCATVTASRENETSQIVTTKIVTIDAKTKTVTNRATVTASRENVTTRQFHGNASAASGRDASPSLRPWCSRSANHRRLETTEFVER